MATTEAELLAAFPRLRRGRFVFTSPDTERYNCIAWAAYDDQAKWWPFSEPIPGVYWPVANAEPTLANFLAAFATLRYRRCRTSRPHRLFEKVAIFVDADGEPTHAARQLPSGAWTSKLGDEEDIEHVDLSGVSGSEYGDVAALLARPRQGLRGFDFFRALLLQRLA